MYLIVIAIRALFILGFTKLTYNTYVIVNVVSFFLVLFLLLLLPSKLLIAILSLLGTNITLYKMILT